jgi:hypothetical protein
MKRQREPDIVREEELYWAAPADGRCGLLEAVREMRAHICSFLAPDPADLAHLAQTCKVFEGELVREQTGFLYYPLHWRRCLESWELLANVRHFDLSLLPTRRTFLIAKAQLHVFAGLKGGQSQVSLHASLDRDMGTLTFTVGKTCKFTFYGLRKHAPRPPEFPTPKEIAAMKEAVRAKHAAKREKDRRNRKIPRAVRQERARLKSEKSELKKTLLRAARDMRDYPSHTREDYLYAYMGYCRAFIKAGTRLPEVTARLEAITREVGADRGELEDEGEEPIVVED